MDEHVRGFYVSEQTIGRGSGCRQAFVKITERRYTSRAIVARLSYIGQESDGVGKETRVLDEKGDEVKPAGFEKAVKEWRFNPKIRVERAGRTAEQPEFLPDAERQGKRPISLFLCRFSFLSIFGRL